MKKVIITGSTGMVGKSVLLECLEHSEISQVLVINRKSLEMQHSKLKEIIHADFYNIDSLVEEFKSYDACFFCLGTSALGKSEEEYSKITYEMTKHWADIMYKINSNMVFNYVSGTGTDSTEKGGTMWARVKGKTENYILGKKFADAYMFRPGAIIPEKGIRSNTFWYQVIYDILKPFHFVLKNIDSITTTTKLGLAMIHSITKGSNKKHLENIDINKLAQA